MHNAITEIKSTLEGTNCRITEAEEWITVLGNRMAEITATEQRKIKGCKEKRTVSETSGTTSNAPTCEL